MKKYLTVGQVAAELDVHPNTVRRWFDSGKLQPYRMGGRILALRSDVDEFIQPQEASTDGRLLNDSALDSQRAAG